MKKIFWTGIIAGIVILVSDLIIGKLFEFAIPSITKEYMSGVFRPWSDPRMMLFLLYPFIIGLILSLVWSKVHPLFGQGTATQKGVRFGFYAWLCLGLPGMFVTYTSFVVSLAIVLSWTVSGFVGMLAAGVLFAKLNPSLSR